MDLIERWKTVLCSLFFPHSYTVLVLMLRFIQYVRWIKVQTVCLYKNLITMLIKGQVDKNWLLKMIIMTKWCDTF